MSTQAPSDIDALEARLRSTWIASDFGVRIDNEFLEVIATRA